MGKEKTICRGKRVRSKREKRDGRRESEERREKMKQEK